MNHGFRTYQSSRSKKKKKNIKEEKEDDENTVLPISIPDSEGAALATLGYFMDKRPVQKHSELSKKP